LLSRWFNTLRKTHISLALVGLMWVLPFLHYRHAYPLTTFDQEWWAVVLGLLAMVTLMGKAYWQSAQTPRVILLPLSLAVVALVQYAIGKVVYFEQCMLYMLYLLFVAQLMLLGAWLRRSMGIEQVAVTLAFALLCGTELSAAIGIYQHFGFHSGFDGVIVRKISAGLYGNLAQPNHYANYITLGVVSLGMLYQQRKINVMYAVALALPLLFVMTLSGSRTTWLYILAMVMLSVWMSYRNRVLRPLLYFAITIFCAYLAMHWLVVQLPVSTGQEVDTNSLRMSDTSSHIRLYLWHEAVLIFMQSPLLGVGFGQYAFHHFELQPILQPAYVSGLYNNAHNVVLQLAAETGLAGLLALFVSMGAWVFGLRNAERSAAHWWCYALIAVITIHSLLEYPLWYAYFLAIIAFLLGMADETSFKIDMPRLGRAAMVVLILLGMFLMGQLKYNYLQLKSAISAEMVPGQPPPSSPLQNLDAIRDGSNLMLPMVDFFISNWMSVDARNIREKIAFNGNAMHYIPSSEVVYRQAYLLAQDGDMEEAKKVMLQALWSYPDNINTHNVLRRLAEKDPAHFSALLEFATAKEQEIARAVRNK
jgi:O-antigen ligase